MSSRITESCMFRLAWITSGEKTPNYYNVVFLLKPWGKDDTFYYISYNFASFEYMYMCLSKLAKAYNQNSIDDLFTTMFFANFSYQPHLDRPHTFEKLYTQDGKIWPCEDFRGHFVIDF